MRKRKRFLPYLYSGLLFLLCLVFFVYVTDPADTLPIFSVQIPFVIFFFLLSITSFFSVFSFIFLNRRRGILSALCIGIIFLIRFFGYKELFYIPIVVAIFVLIEYLFVSKPIKPKKKVAEDPFPLEAKDHDRNRT